jgi:hypothetical protein
MRESVIEKYLVKQVKAVGGEVRKVQWIGRNSAPDRVVMLPEAMGLEESVVVKGIKVMIKKADAALVWVELKAPGEKPTAAQVREHNRMRDVGQTVVVIDSLEGVDELLRGYK